MENSSPAQHEHLHRLMKNRTDNKILMNVTKLTRQQAEDLIDTLINAEEDAREDYSEFLNRGE